jgi:hypothetical protein
MMKRYQAHCLSVSAACTLSLLVWVNVSNAASDNPVCADCPEDPDTFLTLLEKGVNEGAAETIAYYKAVDPLDKKTTYADWLFETGFISNPLNYVQTGSFAFDPSATVVSVVHQNVADLGFVRVMSARCEPSCDDPNPDIYSTIENYSNFVDAAARANRLASVTMEWTAAVDGSNPADKFVVFYAFTGGDQRDQTPGVPFAPDLDGRGNKSVPGLCNSCHGGVPKKLNKDGTYKDNGDTRSLFLPLDLDNFEFGPITQASQEAAYKKMNQISLITHRATQKFDEEAGFSRLPSGHELIEGWYGGPGMPDDTFDGSFIPAGWLPPYAPAGVDELYHGAVAPACRSCHAQQKRELDFGTYTGFMVFEDAHKKLVLSIRCGVDNDSASRDNKKDDQAVMPLALETYKRFWDPNTAAPIGSSQADVFAEFIEAEECEN